METDTPTPTATPYIWVTPTAWPVSASTPEFDIPVNPILVTYAENSVQGWNTFNQSGVLDDFISIVIVILIILIIRRIIRRLMTRSA